MVSMLEQIERLETDRKALIMKINLGQNYNKRLDEQKVNIQDYELALKKVNKELKELRKIVVADHQTKVEQEQLQYDERTKELLKQAKVFYLMQREHIINEFKKGANNGI